MTNHINTSASRSDDEADAAARIWPLNKFVLTLIATTAGCAMGVIAALRVIGPFVAFLAAPLGPVGTLLLGLSGVAIIVTFPWGVRAELKAFRDGTNPAWASLFVIVIMSAALPMVTALAISLIGDGLADLMTPLVSEYFERLTGAFRGLHA